MKNRIISICILAIAFVATNSEASDKIPENWKGEGQRLGGVVSPNHFIWGAGRRLGGELPTGEIIPVGEPVPPMEPERQRGSKLRINFLPDTANSITEQQAVERERQRIEAEQEAERQRLRHD